MNKGILGIIVSVLAIAMLASPSMAIGPQNAVKNPNVDNAFDLGWVQFMLPSGQFTEWVPSPSLGTTILYQHKNADDFHIGNAIEMIIHMATSPSPSDPGVVDMYAFFGAENKWIFLSHDSYWNFLFNGFAMQQNPNVINIANYYSNMYPNGLYIRFVMIGN